MDALFISPPWGGINYTSLHRYTMDHMYPNLNLILDTAFNLTHNLILHIPKNSCVNDICSVLAAYSRSINPREPGTLRIEIEGIRLGH